MREMPALWLCEAACLDAMPPNQRPCHL